MTSSEPLSIIGIDTPNVGTPALDDGTRGSALYVVPIKLSRRPTEREAELLVQHWNQPPSFSSRHRPGIAYVTRDCLVLDGTTVEEVRDCHAATLKLVVAATNASEASAADRDASWRATLAARQEDHERTVADVASTIRFE